MTYENHYVIEPLQTNTDGKRFIRSFSGHEPRQMLLGGNGNTEALPFLASFLRAEDPKRFFILHTKVDTQDIPRMLSMNVSRQASGETSISGLIILLWASYIAFPPSDNVKPGSFNLNGEEISELDSRNTIVPVTIRDFAVTPDTHENRHRYTHGVPTTSTYVDEVKKVYALIRTLTPNLPYIIVMGHEGELSWEDALVANTKRKTRKLLDIPDAIPIVHCQIDDKTQVRQAVRSLLDITADYPGKQHTYALLDEADYWGAITEEYLSRPIE